jgi:hypothetical protein
VTSSCINSFAAIHNLATTIKSLSWRRIVNNLGVCRQYIRQTLCAENTGKVVASFIQLFFCLAGMRIYSKYWHYSLLVSVFHKLKFIIEPASDTDGNSNMGSRRDSVVILLLNTPNICASSHR